MKQFDKKQLLISIIGIPVMCLGIISLGFNLQSYFQYSDAQLNYMGMIFSTGLTLIGGIITTTSFLEKKVCPIQASLSSVEYCEENETEGVININVEIENLGDEVLDLTITHKSGNKFLESSIAQSREKLRGKEKISIGIEIRIPDVEVYLAEYHRDMFCIKIQCGSTKVKVPLWIENTYTEENCDIDEKYQCIGRDVYCWIKNER